MNDQEILEALGMTNMPEQFQKETLEEVNQVVELRLMGVVDDLMSDAQREQFKNLQQDDAEAVRKWLSENFEMDNMYDATLADYIDELKASSAK